MGAADSIAVVNVNVGTPRLLADTDRERVYSAIAKQPVAEGTTLWLSAGNLAGDAQADLSVHGGTDKAVYAYPSEHLAAWSLDLDENLGPAPFGENLSTRGALETDTCIGDLWQWNAAILQVCQPRWPCYKLALYRRRADMQSRMRATGRTGWYLRVVEPGEVVVGDSIEVLRRDPAGLTVTDAHVAMGDRHVARRDLTEALAAHPSLSPEWGDTLRARLALA